jgi:hypothetical protein
MGISKGMWKKELAAAVTGTFDKRSRRGKRLPKGESAPEGVLGKRERARESKSRKTSTDHKKNTSTFKNQGKKR